ncbi:MAG: hypothetical protein ACI3XQ_02145 [Eubacteriales bacterium]
MRAEILRALAVKTENGESENAVELFGENRNIRSYWAVTSRNKTVYHARSVTRKCES